MADHYFLVQRWRPLFIPEDTSIVIQKIVVRVRIPNLLSKLYNRLFLWRVESKLRTILKVDELISIHSRGKFAQICVEIDLRKKLVPSFIALRRTSEWWMRAFT